jgi:hypothetical protein
MRVLLFILGFSLVGFVSPAQMETMKVDSWKIKWNNKTVLETSREDESSNTIKIKKDDLKKKYTLEIVYKEGDVANTKNWKRSILFYDDADNGLMTKDSTRSVKLSAAQLKKLFGDKKTVKIYTMAIPTDPDLAARVRVRRVHLCTLELR